MQKPVKRRGQGVTRRGQKKRGVPNTFESTIYKQLEKLGREFEFETHKIQYEIPVKAPIYTPDFVIKRNKLVQVVKITDEKGRKAEYMELEISPYIYIETKGYFSKADREKHIHIRDCNPDLDIRFVFQKPHNRIHKNSPTTYAKWCDKNGFKWADSLIPNEWLEE